MRGNSLRVVMNEMGKEFLVSISGKQRIRLVVCSGLVLSLDVCWADVRPTTGGSQTPLMCSQVATAIVSPSEEVPAERTRASVVAHHGYS